MQGKGEIMLNDMIQALGWKGGTIHQVTREITRLRAIEASTRALMDHLAFRASVGGYRPTKADKARLQAVNEAFNNGKG